MTTTTAPLTGGYLAQARAFASPYIMGVIDAQDERPLDVAQYVGDGDRAEYEQGFVDEKRAILQFGKDGALTDADLDALLAPVSVDDRQTELDLFDYDTEADDLEDDMLDREFHARGMW